MLSFMLKIKVCQMLFGRIGTYEELQAELPPNQLSLFFLFVFLLITSRCLMTKILHLVKRYSFSKSN